MNGWKSDAVVQDEQLQLHPEASKIVIDVVDKQAAAVVDGLNKLRAARVSTNEEWVEAMDEAAAYLSRLAALPSSTRVLATWLGEADVQWPFVRTRLAQLQVQAGSHPKRCDLRSTASARSNDRSWRCDVAQLRERNATCQTACELIEQRTRGTEKCCLVFTKPTARRLAERYFETLTAIRRVPASRFCATLFGFTVPRALEAEVDPPLDETLIFVGLDEVSLRLLVLEPRLSSPAYVLLTRRNAAYLKATIRSIRGLSGFASLRTRMDALWHQLPEFPNIDEATLLRRDDFVLPTFSFEQGLSSTPNASEENDPNAWELALDGRHHDQAQPWRRAYVYDRDLGTRSRADSRGVEVSELQEGDRLFVMSLELREMTEGSLERGRGDDWQ